MAQGEYELGARVGLGMKIAQELALKYGETAEEALAIFTGRADQVIQFVIDTQAKYLAQTAFPGAVVEPEGGYPLNNDNPPYPQTPAGLTSAPGFAPQQSAPPVPNRSSGGDWKAQKAEANWQTFFQDTTAWDDLRSQKAMGQIKPGNPDWRHKNLKDGDYKIGVWIKDAPQWAVDRLRGMGVQV